MQIYKKVKILFNAVSANNVLGFLTQACMEYQIRLSLVDKEFFC